MKIIGLGENGQRIDDTQNAQTTHNTGRVHQAKSAGRTKRRNRKGESHSEADQPSQSRPKRKRFLPAARGIPHLLPWSKGISKVSAATKIVCLIALSTVILLEPHWSAVAAIGVALLLGSLSARLPISALPVFPIWLWSGVLGGMFGSWLSDGLMIFLRSFAVTLIVVWGSFLLMWTTRLEDIAPAFRTLLSPLRLFRLPVDQWTQAMSFAFRGLGPMQDQTSAVVDATKLRLGSIENMTTITSKALLKLMLDIATASLSAASRRAADTGRALTLRGGVPLPQASSNAPRFGWRDGVTLVVTATACAVPFLTEFIVPLVKQAWTAVVG